MSFAQRNYAIRKRAWPSIVQVIFSRFYNQILAGLPQPANRIDVICDRVIAGTLVLYAVFAPHSIALTEGSALVGAVAWAVQLARTRGFDRLRTPADIALFGFFACCVVSSLFSFVPATSINGLRSQAFFLAFYFVSGKVASVRHARWLIIAIVVSCLINVAWSAGQLIKGRGVRIDAISAGSPFAESDLIPGDVIIEADGQKVNSKEDISRIVDSNRGRLTLEFQRKESLGETSLSRRDIKSSDGSGTDRLGLVTSPGRNFRITGLYSHYETYAEVLQLIAALAAGLIVAYPMRRSPAFFLLIAAAGLIVCALVLTSTRAPIAGLAAAVVVMSLAISRRRITAATVLFLLILVPAAVVAVQRSRGVSFIDPQEGSTAYRLEVWKEAINLVRGNPVIGIGRGTEGDERFKEEYKLFGDGKLPVGHFHSTPVQVAAWWGLAALGFYSCFMTIFIREMWRLSKSEHANRDWSFRAVSLGALGAIVAFNVSSLVHFNFGDGEVAMMLWLISGIGFAVRRIARQAVDGAESAHRPSAAGQDSSNRNQLQQPAGAVAPAAQAVAAPRDQPRR